MTKFQQVKQEIIILKPLIQCSVVEPQAYLNNCIVL